MFVCVYIYICIFIDAHITCIYIGIHFYMNLCLKIILLMCISYETFFTLVFFWDAFIEMCFSYIGSLFVFGPCDPPLRLDSMAGETRPCGWRDDTDRNCTF